MHHSRGVWNRLNILPWKQASWSLFRFHIFSKSLSSHSSGTSWSTDYIILSFWVWQRISFPEALSKVISNIYFNVYCLKCHNIYSKFSTFETLLESFGATIELQIFMIFWSPQGPCRQNHVSQISKAWNNESWLKLTRLSRFSGLLCRFCRKKTAAAPLLPHACGCHSPAAPHLARQMTYGILDYLREGFPWPGRPFKHTESISFTVNIR